MSDLKCESHIFVSDLKCESHIFVSILENVGMWFCIVLYMYKKVEVLFLCLSRKVSACLRKEKFACGLEFGTKGER